MLHLLSRSCRASQPTVSPSLPLSRAGPWPILPSRTFSLSSASLVQREEQTAQYSGTFTSSTPASTDSTSHPPHPTSNSTNNHPYHFLTGHALFAKRPSRPFPPPFLSLPSSSFSDPLSTHNRATDKRRTQQYDGERIRGVTNGDDALVAESRMLAVGDGVGAWAQKERGHAALWSRLVLHFWALEVARAEYRGEHDSGFAGHLQKAYELTKEATGPPNEWFGTTTASGALLCTVEDRPRVQVTQLGDSAVLVLRPGRGPEEALLFKTEEQWHWFDCPRQLGTNSPDTPEGNAVTDAVDVEEGDVVVAISDGVTDNLWIHEVVANVCESLKKEEKALVTGNDSEKEDNNEANEAMRRVAIELVRSARVIAEDPFAESPFMERAVEEGLPTEGGKLDDISVVVGMCRRRPEG